MKRKSKEAVLIKAVVRKRDKYRCTKCGMTNRKHKKIHCGRSLQVHRKNPGSEYSLEGCVTLCVSCHNKEPKSTPLFIKLGWTWHSRYAGWMRKHGGVDVCDLIPASPRKPRKER